MTHDPRRSTEAGWSLLEAAISMTLLAVAIVAVATVITSSLAIVNQNRETALAMEAAREYVESMNIAVGFSSVFAAYNSDTEDDPVGVSCPGSTFVVSGLGRAGGGQATGTVIFPQVGDQLRENLVDASLGMPRDLNGDQVIDANNRSLDYRVLPVTVRIEWNGVGGARSLEFRTLLTER